MLSLPMPVSAAVAEPNELHLQFQCNFDVESLSGGDALIHAINAIKQWLTRGVKKEFRLPHNSLSAQWFCNGGKWGSAGPDRSAITTDRLQAPGIGTTSWAIRYERPESQTYDPASPASSYRIWRTDIGLTRRSQEIVTFSLKTSFYLQSSYIGPEPATPEPTSPVLIKAILQSENLRAFSGTEALTTVPVKISAENADLLVGRIADSARQCPLVYLSGKYPEGSPALDPRDLAWGLAGLATVYYGEDSWVDKRTEKLLPEGFRCWGGRARIYLPGVRLDDPNDQRRHRFFMPQQLESWGGRETLRIVTKSLARRGLSRAIEVPDSIDHIRSTRQQQQTEQLRNRLEHLHSEAASVSQLREMVELLTAVEREQARDLAELRQQLKQEKGLSESLAQQTAELDDAQARLAYDLEVSRDEANQARRAEQELRTQLDRFASLRSLPESLGACAEFFSNAFGHRLAFSEKGLKTAHDADFDAGSFWNALWGMAHELYDLIFEEAKPGDIEQKLRERTGLQIAMTEGSSTKKDKKLMQLRKDSFRGTEIDITPHIKLHLGANRHFRIYFGILNEARLLVIGECSSHMDTAGTRRRGH